MKLVILTSVKEFHKDVLNLFKKCDIESFSGSDIDGYKNAKSLLLMNGWFSSETGGTESSLFFAFTEELKINQLFDEVKAYNANLETNNPIKAIVVPIEQYL